MNASPLRQQLKLIALLATLLACSKLEGQNDAFESRGKGGASASNGGTSATLLSRSTGSFGISNAGRSAQDSESKGGAGTSSFSSEGGTATHPEASIGGRPASTQTSSCIDREGFHGLGCYACTPTDLATLEQACTQSSCVGFDNSTRLPELLADSRVPPLPNVDGSVSAGGASAISSAPDGLGGQTTAPSTTYVAAEGGSTSISTNPPCSALEQQGPVVYITGSSAVGPFLEQIAQQLATTNVHIVYTATGSCVGVDAILNQTPMTTGKSEAPAQVASYWEGPTQVKTCDIARPGILADIGVSDVFAQTCPGFELASLESLGIRDAHGPIQTMVFAVPSNSRYREISAQAAYFVFGFGERGNVLDPTLSFNIWNDEAFLLKRSSTSGTQSMIGATIGVPSAQWKGVPHRTSEELATALREASSNAQHADKAIGILATDYIESNLLRAQIRPLAFQDSGQPCAFYPDSTETARDKRNVRDGHYPIWSPLHLLYRVDSSGSPVRESNRKQVLEILGYLSGSKPLPNNVKLLDVYAQNGLIPECAMHVTRQKDGGNLVPAISANPCSCAFEKTATGNTDCKTCTMQSECPAGTTCAFGYCNG